MGQQLIYWRRAAMAGLIAAICACGPARAQDADPDLQKLLEGLSKDILGGQPNQPAPGNPAALQDLMKGLMKGGTEARDSEKEMAEACLMPLFAPSLSSQSDKAVADELDGYPSKMLLHVSKRQWEPALDITQKALDLERNTKSWPIAAPRELYRAEMWSNRSIALNGRTQGDRADNIEKAIEGHKNAIENYRQGMKSGALRPECAFTLATIEGNLGISYSMRVRGEKAENMDLALAHFEEALKTLNPQTSPQIWATTQMNVGNTYTFRIRGKRADNVERAIAALQATQKVWTRESFPAAWATAQNNLSAAYLRRVRGDQAGNIERAVEAASNGLTVRTREFPSGEKPLPNPLAGFKMPSQKEMEDLGFAGFGDNLTDLLEMTMKVEAQGSRVAVFLHPDGWARSQNTLGLAFFKRVKGDRADNLERAIAAFEASLSLWTRESNPVEWAMAQANLGEALISRQQGKRTENLDRAIAALNAALEVNTPQTFPRVNLSDARLLGEALMAKGDGKGALKAFETARTSFRLLFGQGLNEAEARDLVQEAGPLFTNAAYAAAELGDGRQALARLEEGKARLLAVALKLDRLTFAPAQQQRLGALRVQIKEGEAAYEAAQGDEKAARIAALGRLREELLRLVDAAEAPGRQEAERDVVAFAGKALPAKGALVAPIVAEAGSKIILLVRTGSETRLSVVALPGLTSARIGALLGARDSGGWLGAYSINYLDGDEKTRRWPEWLGGIETIAAELGTALGKPLTEALAAQGLAPGSGTPVTILPAGPLGILPIGLAQHPQTRRYLMEDYVVTLAPSLEALASAKARASVPAQKPSLAVIVNPTGDLPFTAMEGELVASRFASDRRLTVAEGAATQPAVLAALKRRDYWHFSSHGFFDWDDPRASGLWLTGRTPLTVGNLLDARELAAPRLAVLSACETGLYDIATTPNEFIGLPAAFLQLGAGGVLATLWPVSDLSTSLLMAKFYDFHQGEALAPAAALWKAQDWLRRATSDDLEGYMRLAVESGRLSRALAGSLETVTRGSRAKSDPKETAAAGQPREAGRPGLPFSHPYHWSGFALTGL